MTTLSTIIFTGEAGLTQRPATLNIDPVDLARRNRREAQFVQPTVGKQQPQIQQQQQAQASGLGERALTEKVSFAFS